MTRERIVEILTANQYDEKEAFAVSEDILVLSDDLIPIFEKWASSGEIQDFSSNGMSILDLMNRFNKMKFPAVLLTMDWIIKDPSAAIPAIDQGIR